MPYWDCERPVLSGQSPTNLSRRAACIRSHHGRHALAALLMPEHDLRDTTPSTSGTDIPTASNSPKCLKIKHHQSRREWASFLGILPLAAAIEHMVRERHNGLFPHDINF
jgi:hypothetical protein